MEEVVLAAEHPAEADISRGPTGAAPALHHDNAVDSDSQPVPQSFVASRSDIELSELSSGLRAVALQADPSAVSLQSSSSSIHDSLSSQRRPPNRRSLSLPSIVTLGLSSLKRPRRSSESYTDHDRSPFPSLSRSSISIISGTSNASDRMSVDVPIPTPSSTAVSSTSSTAQQNPLKRIRAALHGAVRSRGPGTSSSAVSARINRAKAKAGEFIPNEQLEKQWRKKCLDPEYGDPDAVFTPGNVSTVHHSRCHKDVQVKEPYDFSRFKDHVKNCKGPTKKKEAELAQSPCSKCTEHRAASLPLPRDHPCPGLTASDDSRIKQILERTAHSGGGSRADWKVSKTRFEGAYYSELPDEKKKVVNSIRHHERAWNNVHGAMAVFAVDCEALVSSTNQTQDGRVRPCGACVALFSNPRFKAALKHPQAKPENYKYTNHRFRVPVLGHIYAKVIGVKEIVDAAVRFIPLSYRATVISLYLTPWIGKRPHITISSVRQRCLWREVHTACCVEWAGRGHGLQG